MRVLFRPAYVAGSLDGSVCREIEDPKKNPITVRRLHVSVNQLETYIRALRFKALLGEAVSQPLERTGAKWVAAGWDGDAPDKTRIGIQLRGADSQDALDNTEWSGPDNAEQPYFLKPGPVPAALAASKYLQIRVLLKAEHDADFAVTPAVRSVTVSQEKGTTT